MPLINYDKPMPFPDAVEATAILLQHSLVTLRNEAECRDDANDAPLYAAHFLIEMLEDALATASDLSTQLEQRLADNLKRAM